MKCTNDKPKKYYCTCKIDDEIKELRSQLEREERAGSNVYALKERLEQLELRIKDKEKYDQLNRIQAKLNRIGTGQNPNGNERKAIRTAENQRLYKEKIGQSEKNKAQIKRIVDMMESGINFV